MNYTHLIFTIFSVIFLLVSPLAVEAQFLPDPLQGKTILDIINIIINSILAPIGFGLATIMIIWSGILYMTAGGNKEKVEKAKRTLLWTLIGLIILISAGFIIQLIQQTLTSIGVS
jgi:type IV secretory pathway VirB2 component (pilin)